MMEKFDIETLRPLIQGGRMLETAKAVTGFHRVQASTGFREAAKYCTGRLESLGIYARHFAFPADGVHRDMTSRTMMEWDIQDGFCTVEGFGEIASFKKNPISIITRSIGCDYRNSPLELVSLDRGSNEDDYRDADLEGKLVFVHENFLDYKWAMEKRGAFGVITDYVLHPETQQDVTRYTSLWWKEEPDEKKYFGFVLTPSQGKELAAFCQEKQKTGEKVLVSCFVDARLYAGSLDIVEAFIPGESGQEILIIAHLCHPQSSANDNASGVAAGIEAMAVIREALEKKILAPLARGVRLLLIPEMSGTIAYLRDKKDAAKNILAGINLDMVGAKQENGYGPITLSCLPHAAPSFTEYAAIVAHEEGTRGFLAFDKAIRVPVINACITPFAAGSDHYILSDPTVGIPCTMLGQWPDKYYHTSGDTFERLSSDVLAVSCAIALGFAARMASLTAGQLEGLFARGKLRLAEELESLGRAVCSEKFGKSLHEKGIAHVLDSHKKALEDVLRFFPGHSGAKALIEKNREELVSIARGFGGNSAGNSGGEGSAQAAPWFEDKRVPRRRYVMPVQNMDLSARENGCLETLRIYEKDLRKEFSESDLAEALVQYYMDGRRTLGEIITMITIDLGGLKESAIQSLGAYAELLEKCGLVGWAG
jgi:aminopeptidase-like protein